MTISDLLTFARTTGGSDPLAPSGLDFRGAPGTQDASAGWADEDITDDVCDLLHAADFDFGGSKYPGFIIMTADWFDWDLIILPVRWDSTCRWITIACMPVGGTLAEEDRIAVDHALNQIAVTIRANRSWLVSVQLASE